MPKANDDCQELKNIKYKTMLLQGNNKNPISSSKSVPSNIDELLEKESKLNKLEPWSKLDKTVKMSKLTIYSDNLKKTHDLNINEIDNLKEYLSNCLDKKHLQRVKDVVYDKDTGLIKNIPILAFNNTTRKFYLKKDNKHISTVKSLAPKKKKPIKEVE
jgi:hypothetical protein